MPQLSRPPKLSRLLLIASYLLSLAPPAPAAHRPSPRPVRPILECVSRNADGSHTAQFGYNNRNAAAVTIPVSAKNGFTPAPVNRGQPSTFAAGRKSNVLRVTFNTRRIVWAVTGPDGRTRRARASAKKHPCGDEANLVVDAGADMSVTLPAAATLDGDVAEDGMTPGPNVTIVWTKVSGPGTASFADAASPVTTVSFSVPGAYVLRLTASKTGETASDDVTVTVLPEPDPLPSDPAAVAPPRESGASSSLFETTAFLYTGPNPIQTGVSTGTVTAERVCILRGRVTDKTGAPLSGVRVSVLSHPELGQTKSRADGMFDLAVNGGGNLTVEYRKNGYITGQRTVHTPWGDWAAVPEIAMAPLDGAVTAVNFSSPQPVTARGTVSTDAVGPRQATVVFSTGTAATLVMADGSLIPAPSLHVRATEFTVGPGGPAAMPAALPASSAYTYALELTADEAEAAGAVGINFSRPARFYLENFLGFDAGVTLPVGYYDKVKGLWMPSESGKVVKLLSAPGGIAVVDTDGDGTADDGLSMDETERRTVAGLYAPGRTFWRVEMTHFTAYDINLGFAPPDNAQFPGPLGMPKERPLPDPCRAFGSDIECENQILGESIPVAGTGMTLNHRSDRTPGYQDLYRVKVPLTGPLPPSGLRKVHLEVHVAGRTILREFPPDPDQSHEFLWDGLDAWERRAQGRRKVTVRVGYAYGAVYSRVSRFGYNGSGVGGEGTSITRSLRDPEVILWREDSTTLGSVDARGWGIGGWTLDAHHLFDTGGGNLYKGDGERSRPREGEGEIQTVAGGGTRVIDYDSVLPAKEAAFLGGYAGFGLSRVLPLPDGGYYVVGEIMGVYRVDHLGILRRYAGRSDGDLGDGGRALDAAGMNRFSGAAAAPDGTLYLAISQDNVIRRVRPDGIIDTLAGTRQAGYSGDGGPATAARLNGPGDLTVGRDGTVYFADGGNNVVRRVGTDGVISTFAGTGVRGSGGDGGPATLAKFSDPFAVAAGPDGSVYIGDYQGGYGQERLRRVAPDGNITSIAGANCSGRCEVPEGVPATESNLSGLRSVAVAPDGKIYLTQGTLVRVIDQEGIIRSIAGGTQFGTSDGGPALGASMTGVGHVAVGPDGAIYIAELTYYDGNRQVNGNRVRRISAPSALNGGGATTVPSEDGSEVYVFTRSGRHLRTLDALSGAATRSFAYNAAGLLSTVTDGDGNAARVEYDAAGVPTAIVSPDNQRTTLATNAAGWLAAVTNPAGEAVRMEYAPSGLLTQFVDAKGGQHLFQYDSLGFLTKDADPAGGSQSLSQALLSDIGQSGQDSNGFQTERRTGEGRVTAYKVEDLKDGGLRRTVTGPDGLSATSLRTLAGSTFLATPDGASRAVEEGGDPVWSMMAPQVKRVVDETPGGLRREVINTQTATQGPGGPTDVTDRSWTSRINGNTWTTAYQRSTGQLTAETPEHRQTTAILDPQGRVKRQEVPGTAPITYAYDARGRLIGITQSDPANPSSARTSAFAYDNAGNLSRVTDPLNRATQFAYDGANRITTQTFPDGRTVSYAYDANGNRTALTPPGRPAHGFTYTPVDLIAAYAAPSPVIGAPKDETTYAYNLDKQPTTITRPDGRATNVAYDAAGRPETVTTHENRTTYAYDAAGRLSQAVFNPLPLGEGQGEGLSYAYDGDLPLSTSWAGPVQGKVSRTYDNDFRVTAQGVNGSSVTFSYDRDGLLTGSGALAISHDAQTGRLTGTTMGSVNDQWTYSPFNEPTAYEAKINGVPVYSVTMTRDKLGRITAKTEAIEGQTSTYGYTYDLAGRLTDVSKNGAVINHYEYDANGNRTISGLLPAQITATYDDQDRLQGYGNTQYTYNRNGELLTKAVNGQTTTYDYDTQGTLRGAALPDGTVIEYVIDAQGRRVGKKVNGTLTQGFLYDGQLKIVAELDGTGTIVSRFVYGDKGNVPAYMVKGGSTYRIISDHLGSPRLVLNAEMGEIVQALSFDAFGQVINDTAPGLQPFGFAGGLYDQHARLVGLGARDYDPELGRWKTKDPILFDGEDANLYGYVFNDPINFIDPFGLLAIGAPAGSGGTGSLWPYPRPLPPPEKDKIKLPCLGDENQRPSPEMSFKKGNGDDGRDDISRRKRKKDKKPHASSGGDDRFIKWVKKKFGLNKDQQQRLHREISRGHYSNDEIIGFAQDSKDGF